MKIFKLQKEIQTLEKRINLAKQLQKIKSSLNAKKVLQNEIQLCNYKIEIKKLVIRALKQESKN